MFNVITDYPIATDSPDNIKPHGAINDNSINRNFNRAVYEYFKIKPVRVLDIGCAGGGMVKTFIDDGHIAIGLEGCEQTKKHKRAEWQYLSDTHLFNCDCSKEFTVTENDKRMIFDVVTAWEVMEHFKPEDIPTVLTTLTSHMHAGSLFACSIPLGEWAGGSNDFWHQTQKPKEWWYEMLEEHSLYPLVKQFERDCYVRGDFGEPHKSLTAIFEYKPNGR